MRVEDPYPPKAPPGQDELPCSDGEPMETERHWAQFTILVASLGEAWIDRDDFYVAGNMFVYFSELQVRHNDFRGPDVFVVMNVPRRERKSWVAWEEGGRLPDVVVEVTSPTTERVDRGEKMRIYARVWKTGEYYIFDPETSVLEGYRLVANDYEPMERDARGDYRSRILGVGVGVREGSFLEMGGKWARWLDDEGNPLPWLEEHKLRAEAESARAEAESARAEAESARAEAESARAEAESARADAAAAEAEAERARAEAATALADAERKRADELTARIAELEARLATTKS